MPEQPTLTIERRDRAGSAISRRLRHEGKVPAVLYGHGSKPELIAISQRSLADLLAHGGHSALVQLQIDGKRLDTALLRELQHDPVSRKIIHADLQRVSANEEVRTKLPIVTVGVAVGVKDFGGVMDVLIHEIEVEGPASRLPEHLEVDVEGLNLHEHLTATQVKLPDGFQLLTPPDTIVVAIEPSKVARALEEAEAAGPAAEQLQPERVGETPPEGA
jgi:large subunit ribosomal protein L25